MAGRRGALYGYKVFFLLLVLLLTVSAAVFADDPAPTQNEEQEVLVDGFEGLTTPWKILTYSKATAASLSKEYASEGKQSLKLDYNFPGGTSTAEVGWIFGLSDWTKVDRIVVDIYVPTENRYRYGIVVGSDRWYSSVIKRLKQGWNMNVTYSLNENIYGTEANSWDASGPLSVKTDVNFLGFIFEGSTKERSSVYFDNLRFYGDGITSGVIEPRADDSGLKNGFSGDITESVLISQHKEALIKETGYQVSVKTGGMLEGFELPEPVPYWQVGVWTTDPCKDSAGLKFERTTGGAREGAYVGKFSIQDDGTYNTYRFAWFWWDRPRDFRDVSKVKFYVYNPGTYNLQMTMCVNYNGEYWYVAKDADSQYTYKSLAPGWNTYTIDLDAVMAGRLAAYSGTWEPTQEKMPDKYPLYGFGAEIYNPNGGPIDTYVLVDEITYELEPDLTQEQMDRALASLDGYAVVTEITTEWNASPFANTETHLSLTGKIIKYSDQMFGTIEVPDAHVLVKWGETLNKGFYNQELDVDSLRDEPSYLVSDDMVDWLWAGFSSAGTLKDFSYSVFTGNIMNGWRTGTEHATMFKGNLTLSSDFTLYSNMFTKTVEDRTEGQFNLGGKWSVTEDLTAIAQGAVSRTENGDKTGEMLGLMVNGNFNDRSGFIVKFFSSDPDFAQVYAPGWNLKRDYAYTEVFYKINPSITAKGGYQWAKGNAPGSDLRDDYYFVDLNYEKDALKLYHKLGVDHYFEFDAAVDVLSFEQDLTVPVKIIPGLSLGWTAKASRNLNTGLTTGNAIGKATYNPSDKWKILLEYDLAVDSQVQPVENYSAEINYILSEGLRIFGRYGDPAEDIDDTIDATKPIITLGLHYTF